jgi:hypothetical protein
MIARIKLWPTGLHNGVNGHAIRCVVAHEWPLCSWRNSWLDSRYSLHCCNYCNGNGEGVVTPTSYAQSILYIRDDSTVAAHVNREFGARFTKERIAKIRARQSQPRWRK